MAYHLVGVDLGGTKIATALTDTDSEILKYETVELPPDSDADTILALILESIRRVTAEVRQESILGVGIAFAGLVDPKAGEVVFSPNLNLRNVPIREKLGQALKWPIYVAHDIAMAALCEVNYGAAKGRDDVLTVWVGTGIGAGLVVNGVLYQGAHGFAGELGQNTVRWDGPECPGGNRGCLEHYASGPAMRRMAAEAIAGGRKTMLSGDAESITVEQISSAAQLGDAVAIEIIDATAEVLGAGLTNALNMMNPEMLVLGGGVVRSVPMLLEKLREQVAKRALPSGLRTEIVQAEFGREAAVIGATVFAKMAGRPESARR